MGGFKEALAQSVARVERQLSAEFAKRSFGPLSAPMEYAVLNGGKRLRSFLVQEVAKICEANEAEALYPAAAIECIHAYSLVHDDMPAMDDDDLRRGKPTVHVKWDEATAVLVGDGLQALAFELVADPSLDLNARAELTLSLARAAGGSGMVLGQALDIAAEVNPVSTIEQICEIQNGKTGALIKWSAEAGAITSGADPKVFGQYASHLGLAFQIQDDILDVTGDEAAMGKRLQKDEAAGKATFVSLLGLEAARGRAKHEVDAALDLLTPIKGSENLQALASYIISRDT